MKRIAIIGGCRTPFVKAGGVLSKYSSLDLAIHVTEGVCSKLNLKKDQIDEIAASTVLLNPRYPNLAREIVLRSSLPKTVNAHFVSNNCISGLVAVSVIANSIKEGRIKCGLAIGTESMSQPTLTLHPKAEAFFLRLGMAKSLGDKLKLLGKFRPGFIMPQAPSPKEPSTGLTMGQHCELSAQEFGISREAQDKVAFRSHQNAAAAQKKGYLAEEIIKIKEVEQDNLIRPDTSIEKLSKLKPVFERSEKGTITAGSSSALTDGAAAVCLMEEEFAKANGYPILGYLDGLEFAAIDPKDGLLMAPALALPALLERHSLTIGAVDLFEVHEAFAAQLLANQLLWEKGWAKYSKAKAVGRIPEEKLNLNGGSIAIGHPFAATGGRLILSTLNQLKRSGKKTGAISVCAAGAMASAVLLRTS
jgi:acetyl-CoA acetyltransferase family protein